MTQPSDQMPDRTRVDKAALLRRAAQHIVDAANLVDMLDPPSCCNTHDHTRLIATARAFHRRADALDKEQTNG